MTVGVATLGMFDGFHRGHQDVLARARRRAERTRARLVVFTFERSPALVLAGRPGEPRLMTLAEKVTALRGGGADEVRVLRFTPELAAKSSRRFLADHLYRDVRLIGLVIGYDFALGRDREGTRDVLTDLGRSHGFVVESVEASIAGGAPISSTRIRDALASGAVEEVRDLLGRSYPVTGRVVPGDGRGGGLGFPTANLEAPPEKLLPAPGVYAGRVEGPGLPERAAAVNLGHRPTFEGTGIRLEAHLPGFRGDLSGATLTLRFDRRLRDERKFKDINELRDQIGRDVAEVLGGGSPEAGGGESG